MTQSSSMLHSSVRLCLFFLPSFIPLLQLTLPLGLNSFPSYLQHVPKQQFILLPVSKPHMIHFPISLCLHICLLFLTSKGNKLLVLLGCYCYAVCPWVVFGCTTVVMCMGSYINIMSVWINRLRVYHFQTIYYCSFLLLLSMVSTEEHSCTLKSSDSHVHCLCQMLFLVVQPYKHADQKTQKALGERRAPPSSSVLHLSTFLDSVAMKTYY